MYKIRHLENVISIFPNPSPNVPQNTTNPNLFIIFADERE